MVKSSGVHIFPIVQGAQTISTKLLAQIFYVEHNDSAQLYIYACWIHQTIMSSLHVGANIQITNL